MNVVIPETTKLFIGKIGIFLNLSSLKFCRNECSFSIGYMQIALYFCFRRYNNSGAKTFQVNMSLICMKMRRSRNTFSYDWFHMKTYLNMEAKNNFQMMDIEGANLQWL